MSSGKENTQVVPAGSAPAPAPASAPAPAPAPASQAVVPAPKQGLAPAAPKQGLAPAQKKNDPLIDALVDPMARKVDGRLGAYTRSDSYINGKTIESGKLPLDLMTRPKLGAACAESDRGCTLFRGPADGAPAKPVASLFPLALGPGDDGFDAVLVDSPLDLLYADQLMGEDTNVLTTTRNQSRDLRGEPSIEGMYTVDKFGKTEPGVACGAYQSSLGAYAYKKAVRQFV